METKIDIPELVSGPIGSKVIFGEDCSLVGIMLWVLSRFDCNVDGSFKTLDREGNVIPTKVYKEFQDNIYAAIEKLEQYTIYSPDK